MISYKYKLYRTDKTKHLDKMLREAAFVWNLHSRYRNATTACTANISA